MAKFTQFGSRQPLLPRPVNPSSWPEPPPQESVGALLAAVQARVVVLARYVEFLQVRRVRVVRGNPEAARAAGPIATMNGVLDQLERLIKTSRFDRGFSPRSARAELRFLRGELVWAAWRQRNEQRDREEWNKAQAWVKQDTAEVEADLLETLSSSIPRAGKESDTAWSERASTALPESRVAGLLELSQWTPSMLGRIVPRRAPESDEQYIARLRRYRESLRWEPNEPGMVETMSSEAPEEEPPAPGHPEPETASDK